MMKSNSTTPRITLGYDLDRWRLFGEKVPISIDLSPKSNSHILLSGMSGSGKSYLENAILAKLALAEPDGEIFFADYKSDDSFFHLRPQKHYYSYTETLTALEIVHNRLLARQSGKDTSRNPVTLIWDEYMAQVLALISEDKKAASIIMGRVSEILMLGRSLAVRLVISCQRPDALAFPAGSRLNLGVICILGGAVRSTYEMLMPPEFIDAVKGRRFGRGEGVAVFQGSEQKFIKVGMVGNVQRMENICIEALRGKS